MWTTVRPSVKKPNLLTKKLQESLSNLVCLTQNRKTMIFCIWWIYKNCNGKADHHEFRKFRKVCKIAKCVISVASATKQMSFKQVLWTRLLYAIGQADLKWTALVEPVLLCQAGWDTQKNRAMIESQSLNFFRGNQTTNGLLKPLFHYRANLF